MRSLVVVESMFGNTRHIAEAIADGLATAGSVILLDVAEAPHHIDGGIDLLVVGGPTHAFGMSRPETRRSASEQGAEARVTGLREWLSELDHADRPLCVATFSTRVRSPLPGSAARGAARRLRHLGYRRLIAPPSDFFVAGTPGPLRPGEHERAEAWGQALGREVPAPAGR